MHERIEIPWPLAKGVYKDGKGHYCIMGWLRENHDYLEVGKVRNALRKRTNSSITELNDARAPDADLPAENYGMENRLNLLLFGLLASGYDPVIVDTETGKEIG